MRYRILKETQRDPKKPPVFAPTGESVDMLAEDIEGYLSSLQAATGVCHGAQAEPSEDASPN